MTNFIDHATGRAPLPPMPKCMRVLAYGPHQIKIMQDKTLRFRYELTMHSPGDFAEFSLLSEVGQPYRPAFDVIIDTYQLVLGEPKEYDQRPWLADTVASVLPPDKTMPTMSK